MNWSLPSVAIRRSDSTRRLNVLDGDGSKCSTASNPSSQVAVKGLKADTSLGFNSCFSRAPTAFNSVEDNFSFESIEGST